MSPLERATLDELGAVGDVDHAQARRAAVLILAAGGATPDDAREVAQMLGLLPSPPPREPGKAYRDARRPGTAGHPATERTPE
jgi:hypothetical protein